MSKRTLQKSATLIAVACVLAVLTPVAHAAKKVDSFFPVDGVSSGLGGHFKVPRGIAVNQSNPADPHDNWIYVVDSENHRIQAFSPPASPGDPYELQWAIGRDVSSSDTSGDGGAAAERCTTASDCKSGLPGSLGAMFSNPQGIDVDQADGHLFVRDAGNKRVQELTADGAFVRAFGANVVQPGGAGDVATLANERQTVKLLSGGAISGGTFTLSFSSQTTAAIPFNATGTQLGAALEALPAIGTGGVSVNGPAGGPWTVEFTGTLAGVNVAQLSGNAAGLSGGFGNSVQAITLTAGGTEGNFEVCTVASQCKAGGDAAGSAGGFAGSSAAGNGIAVAPLGSPTAGQLFVGDPGNQRVMQFDPTQSGAGLFVRAWGWGVDSGADQFEICTAMTSCQPGSTATFPGAPGKFGSSQPTNLAVDSHGVVYASNKTTVGFAEEFRVERFDSSVFGDGDGPGSPAAGLLLNPMPGLGGGTFGGTFGALAVDPDSDGPGPDVDRLYESLSSYSAIKEYDLSTEPPTFTDSHGADAGVVANGIAVNSSLGPCPQTPCTGTIYVSASNVGNRVYALDEDGNTAIPDVLINPPTDVSGHEATVTGSVNPQGFPTTYRFQYSANGVTWVDASAAQDAGSGFTAVSAVPVTLHDLEANTLYRVRLLVTRGFGNGSVPSSELVFATDALAPDVVTLPVNGRGADTATLAGQINPNGSATTYRFEYGLTSSYGATSPVPDAAAGAGGVSLQVNQPISGLRPGASYHYRLCAISSEGSVCGSDQRFSTRAAQVSSSTGRAYELVSPPDKVGGQGVSVVSHGDAAASRSGAPSLDGERYLVEGQNGAVLLDGKFSYASDVALAERASDQRGWVSHSPFTRPHFGAPHNKYAEPYGASDDLSLMAWKTNAGYLAMFPEVEGLGLNGSTHVATIGDWQGRYEVIAPTTAAQGDPNDANVSISADGSAAVLEARGNSVDRPWNGGLTGPGDPFLDRTAGAALYVDGVSAGLSDTFPGGGIREAVGICDAGTKIPGVEAGMLVARDCPAPPANRDAALLDPRGAAPPADAGVNANSRDGSRIFFMSPDPGVSGVMDQPCGGEGPSSACPPQLYVRYRDPGTGQVSTRWVSSPRVPDQRASLLGPAIFEAATPDGDKVFFRTSSPLTPDDPNTGGTCTEPCTVGNASASSWDLYEYDFTDDPTDDPGSGILTRISAGPTGAGDCNVQPRGEFPALRFASDDGKRLYFTCAAPLPGVPAAGDGTITTPTGTATTTGTTNLYLYDANRPSAERYRFVAALPRSFNSFDIAACASTGAGRGGGIAANQTSRVPGHDGDGVIEALGDCVRGTSDGSFVTFVTSGRLLQGDPDTSSGDIYGYEVAGDELTRISAPQGGRGGSYPCAYGTDATGAITSVSVRCNADDGRAGPSSAVRPLLGIVTEPAAPDEHVAFFESKSRLVPDDEDDEYDVYQWRNGVLSLLSTDTSSGAYYASNSSDGQDVFLLTRDRLSWQDTDSVMDVYDARVGGGIPEPPGAAPCGVLAGSCQASVGAPGAATAGSAAVSGMGNVAAEPARKKHKSKKHKPARKKRKHKGKHVKHQRQGSKDRRAEG